MSLWSIALLIRLIIQNRFQLEIFDKSFAEDFEIDYDYGDGDHSEDFHC